MGEHLLGLLGSVTLSLTHPQPPVQSRWAALILRLKEWVRGGLDGCNFRTCRCSGHQICGFQGTGAHLKWLLSTIWPHRFWAVKLLGSVHTQMHTEAHTNLQPFIYCIAVACAVAFLTYTQTFQIPHIERREEWVDCFTVIFKWTIVVNYSKHLVFYECWRATGSSLMKLRPINN